MLGEQGSNGGTRRAAPVFRRALDGGAPVKRALARTRHVLGGGMVLVGLLVGCGASATERGPGDALRAYASAIEERRIDDAYRMLSEDARRTVSLEAFRRMVLESPDDVLEMARALSRPAGEPEVTATVVLPGGDEILLVHEAGRWRVDASAIDLYGQSTPRQALAGFIRAFERKRYDVLLRYVPDAELSGLAEGSAAPVTPPAAEAGAPEAQGAPAAPTTSTSSPSTGADALTADKLRATWEGPQREEIERVIQALRAALPTATIEETGDVASMSFGSGGTVSLLRERGAWKIRDF